MQVQVNTDNNITGSETLADQVNGAVENALGHLSDHITRIEVHLSDENGRKAGIDDKRCVMEARLEGLQPVSVSHQDSTVGQAIDGAAGKLGRMIASTIDRQRDEKRRRTDPPIP